MKPLTIVYISSRKEPEVNWFLDSLRPQLRGQVRIIVVTSQPAFIHLGGIFHAPKPTVWQGPWRLTREDWWAASNSRNTGLCLCRTEWIAFLDDRCVLLPTWMAAVEEAMNGNYCVCGAYEKRTGMTVENGVIQHGGIVTGEDSRLKVIHKHWKHLANPYPAPPEWTYGCSLAMPTEWALEVNGFEELCDGMAYEDTLFGMMLANNGYPIKYDTRMALVQDRTPEKSEPVMRREDKGISPNDKSHALLAQWKGAKRAKHQWNLGQVRADVLAGQTFPVPTGPTTDWYDGQNLNEM